MFSYPKSGMFRLLALPILVEAAGPVVQTPLGEVQGITTAFGGRGFLGLPFAEPPVGEYRFKPARKKQPWSGTLDATKFKPACLQTAVVPGLTQDESCLFLQVFTPPHANSGSNLPVYFWIHGGSFLFGSGASYNGTVLANAGSGSVVVTVNYRLGAFGFFQSEEIAKQDPKYASLGGANGVADQLAALQWTRDNIASFGGDPSRVTIGGESAGSLSACLVACSPLSKGLFQDVVMESGSCIGPWGPKSPQLGLQFSTAFANSLGAASLADLRALAAPTILHNSLYATVTVSIDRLVIPDDPLSLYSSGNISIPSDGRVLMGSNTLDTLYGPPWNDPGAATTPALFQASLAKYFGKNAAAVAAVYGAVTTDQDAYRTWLQINGDACNMCPTRSLASLLTVQGHAVYLYAFGFNPGSPPDHALEGLAGHATELPFAFGVPFAGFPNEGFPWQPALAAATSDSWAAFIRTGDPNAKQGAGLWQPFNTTTQPFVLVDSPSLAAKKGYRRQSCDFFDEFNLTPANYLQFLEFCIQYVLPGDINI